jgi:hypothetical protein
MAWRAEALTRHRGGSLATQAPLVLAELAGSIRPHDRRSAQLAEDYGKVENNGWQQELELYSRRYAVTPESEAVCGSPAFAALILRIGHSFRGTAVPFSMVPATG